MKAEKLYYTALIAYIWYEAPEEEQNFSMLIDLVDASEAREDDENFKNAVDLLFEELELDTLGEKKTALFVIISDTDTTFNFIVSIMYSQLFNLLCDKADDVYNGRLPIHVRCLLDEFANSVTRSTPKMVGITDKSVA